MMSVAKGYAYVGAIVFELLGMSEEQEGEGGE
jgi:hypothetical protein